MSLSAPNKLLVVSVMVVLGCFAITALALRIGNRILKMRKKGNKKTCGAYFRSICPKRNTQPRPKPMKVTVRMTRQTSSKKGSVKSISSRQSSIRTITSTASTSSILRHSKSLANLPNSADIPSTSHDSANSVKRSRTMDALLEIGAFSPDFSELSGPENLLESSSEATLLCRENRNKRTRFLDEVYDNPLMKFSNDESTGENSFGSQTELQLFMDRPDSKDNLSDSSHRSSNNSPICIITHIKSDIDSSESSEKSFENSETESQGDAARRKFQFNKCLKWSTLQQRCSSKDSGYCDTTTPTSPCQDGEMLPMQDFKIVDETAQENDNDYTSSLQNRRRSLDSPGNSSPSSCYPLSSIEESPPPKQRYGMRRDSSLLNSDESLYEERPQVLTYSQEGERPQLPMDYKPWRQNISGLLRDTLAQYLYTNDRQYQEGYDTKQYHQTGAYTYYYPTHETQQYDAEHDDTAPSPSLLRKFFKKRTSTISTQTNGPPLKSKPSVKWTKENGTFMIKPREDAGMEFMGPIYLAKSVEDFGTLVTGSVMDKDKQ